MVLDSAFADVAVHCSPPPPQVAAGSRAVMRASGAAEQWDCLRRHRARASWPGVSWPANTAPPGRRDLRMPVSHNPILLRRLRRPVGLCPFGGCGTIGEGAFVGSAPSSTASSSASSAQPPCLVSFCGHMRQTTQPACFLRTYAAARATLLALLQHHRHERRLQRLDSPNWLIAQDMILWSSGSQAMKRY